MMQHDRTASLASTSGSPVYFSPLSRRPRCLRAPGAVKPRLSTSLYKLHAIPTSSKATSSRDDTMEQVADDAFSPTSSGSDIDIAPLTKPLDDLEITSELNDLKVLATAERRYEALLGWIGAAVAFGAGVWYFEGAVKGQEYFAGYLLEQSLSVDNLFVFVLVFGFFKTPPEAQNKALTFGIITAMVLRAIMIVLGIDLIKQFRPVLVFFAAILIYTSYKLLMEGNSDEDSEDLSHNPVVVFCRQYIQVSDHYDGDRFFTVREGVREATPLLLVLAVIELSDVLFAVDSIPAVFGVTLDPFIVYTSNVFAIVSLRSLYGFVSTMMSELRFLDKAVATVLGFIGVKMLIGFADVEIPTGASLAFVGLVLGGGVTASMFFPEKSGAGEKKKQHDP